MTVLVRLFIFCISLLCLGNGGPAWACLQTPVFGIPSCDNQNGAKIVYGSPSDSSVRYDCVAASAAAEKITRPSDNGLIFEEFGKSEAAESGVMATREGLIDISEHLATRFDPDAPTQLMYGRLVNAFEQGEALTGVDATFYQHELIESELMDAGIEARAAHLQTLQIQGIPYQAGYESLLYSSEALKLINPGF
jgi:hypothetical protein